MDLYYGILDEGALALAGSGWLDGPDLDDVVTLRVQPRAIAPAGIGQHVALGRAYLIVRHDGPCRVRLTPVVDDVIRDDLTETFDLADLGLDVVRDEVVRLDLSEPATWPGQLTPFSRQALRGVLVTVQAELEPLSADGVASPVGDVFAFGGLEVDVRPVGQVAGSSIPVAP